MTVKTENAETGAETQTEDLTNQGGAADQVVEQVNPLELSDEDFLKQGPPPANAVLKTEVADDKGAEGGEGGGDGKVVDKDPTKTGSETVVADGVKPEAKTGDAGEEKTTQTEAKPGEKTGEKAEVKEPVKNAGEIDYAAVGKALLAPFKANGREVRVETEEDARALMQMGANYNKKMAALKPSLKVLKLLENNDLLSEEKLGFLIDLSKKDPAAINKLVKESGINPMEIDPEKAGEYKPTARKVDDREVELDTVLDDIKESPSYTKTLGIAQAWDADSKKAIGDQPMLLKVINDHVDRGIYDLISTEVERERILGRLQGLSDIAAYKQVGDAIQLRGGFAHLSKPDGATQGKPSGAGTVVEPKPKQVDDEARNDKRRALGSPRAAASGNASVQDFNPLGLPDDEFLKQATPKFR